MIGFIGLGNMGGALAEGLLRKKEFRNKVLAYDIDKDMLEKKAKEIGVLPATEKELMEQSKLVILAVKPYLVEEILLAHKEKLKGKIILSIAAGKTHKELKQALEDLADEKGEYHLVCGIPNVPVSIGEGIFCMEQEHSLMPEQVGYLETLLAAWGDFYWISSELIGIAGTISGCSPAYVAMFMEALADAGVKHGLPRGLAIQLVAGVTRGSADLLRQKDMHPGELKDSVCSPGGTTIRGVARLEEKGMRGAVIAAIDAVENK